MSENLQPKKPRKKRDPNKPKVVTAARKLVSRIEAAEILGYSPDSLKRLEKKRRNPDGPLDVVKLRGPHSNTFYKVEQINAMIEAKTVKPAPDQAS